MRRPPSDLIVVAALAVVCALIVLVAADVPLLRTLGAVPLALFLPGYAIAAACLPQRSLGQVERLLISLSLSVVSTALLGLVLYWSGLRLQTATWASALALTTIVASGIAWRRKPAAEGEREATRPAINLNLRDVVWIGLAVVIAGAALGIARLPSPASGVSGYTQLWLTPANDGNTANYQAGITSQEFATVTYHLQVMVDGRVIRDWPELPLAPGATWTSPIVLPPDQLNAGSIEAALYRLDNPNVIYRQVKLQRQK